MANAFDMSSMGWSLLLEQWKHPRQSIQNIDENCLRVLLADLNNLKEKYVYEQSAARLYRTHCFLNVEEDEVKLIHERYQLLFNVSARMGWTGLCCEIIASSIVSEWPVKIKDPLFKYRSDPTSNTIHGVWDRAALVYNKAKSTETGSTRKSSIAYQIRILALSGDHLNDFTERLANSCLETVRAESWLHEAPKSTTRLGRPEKGTCVGSIWNSGGTNDRKRTKKNEKGVDPDQGSARIESSKIETHVVYWSRGQMPNEDGRGAGGVLSFGSGTDISTVCVEILIPSFSTNTRCGRTKFQIYTELFLDLNINRHIFHIQLGQDGINGTPYGIWKRDGICSVPFELTTNSSQHDDTHFLPFAWQILLQYRNSLEENESSGSIEWKYVKKWVSGMMAVGNDFYCRPLDGSELRYFECMLMIRRAVDMIDGIGRTASHSWSEIVQTFFGNKNPAGAKSMNTPDQKKHAIVGIFNNDHIQNGLLVNEKDFSENTYYIEGDKYIRHLSTFSPIQWLVSAADIVTDSGRKLNEEPEFTTRMFNEKFLAMRRQTSLSQALISVTKVNPDQTKVPDRVSPNVYLRIDNRDLHTLSIGYHGGFPNEKPKFGRITVDVLHQRKLWIQDGNRSTECHGLRAYFKNSYAVKFSMILKMQNQTYGEVIPIFPISGYGSSLYRDLKEMPLEKEEIDAIVGPIDGADAKNLRDPQKVDIRIHYSRGTARPSDNQGTSTASSDYTRSPRAYESNSSGSSISHSSFTQRSPTNPQVASGFSTSQPPPHFHQQATHSSNSFHSSQQHPSPYLETPNQSVGSCDSYRQPHQSYVNLMFLEQERHDTNDNQTYLQLSSPPQHERFPSIDTFSRQINYGEGYARSGVAQPSHQQNFYSDQNAQEMASMSLDGGQHPNYYDLNPTTYDISQSMPQSLAPPLPPRSSGTYSHHH